MRETSRTLKVTPAGRRYMGFLAIFNTGDAERIREYISEYYSDEALGDNTVEEMLAWHLHLYEQTGGLKIHNVYLSEEHYVIIVVMDRLNEGMHMDKMKVSEDFPHKITEYLHVPAEL
jgi:hypothetical protein